MLLHLVSIPIPGIPLYVIPGVVRTPRRRGGRPPGAGLPPRSSPGSAFPRLSQIIYQIFSHKGIVMMIVQCTIYNYKNIVIQWWLYSLVLSHIWVTMYCRVAPVSGSLRKKIMKVRHWEEKYFYKSKLLWQIFQHACDCTWGFVYLHLHLCIFIWICQPAHLQSQPSVTAHEEALVSSQPASHIFIEDKN